jgi:hypothetical protein
MFNHGSTALPFEPYKEDTWQLPETLELGEWDELNPQTVEVTRATERIVFDGTENWTKAFGFYFLEGVTASSNNNGNFGICNYYKYSWKDIAVTNNGSVRVALNIANNFPTVEDWKAHLAELYAAGTPLMVAYEKEEFTIEKIEGCPLAYTAFKSGTETVIQGEVDNSQFGAIPTIETGHTIMMEIIGDENG